MLKTIAKTIIFTVPVTVTVLDTFGYVAKVEGASMQPCLNPIKQPSSDFVFLNRWKIRDYTFQRGEIVCVTCPRNPDQKLIKRIVALEGDTVKTMGYKETYVKVPPGQCWVEGDHHKRSMDSNFFGPVALGLITAKASSIVWPPSRWQLLKPASVEDRLLKSDIVELTEELRLSDSVDGLISSSYNISDNDVNNDTVR